MKKTLLLQLFVLSFFMVQAQDRTTKNDKFLPFNSIYGPYVKQAKKESVLYKSAANVQILDSNIHTTFNNVSGLFQKNTKYIYTYNQSGNNTKQITQGWDTTSLNWINSSSIDYTYNVSGSLTSEVYYNWNKANSVWVESSKNEYTRDNNQNITLAILYTWDGTKWVNYYKYEYFYTGTNIESITIYEWKNSAWAINSGYEYEIDNQNRVESYIYFIWQNGSFANSAQLFYTYNANNKLIKTLEQWYNDGEGWVDNKIFDYNFAANGDLLSIDESYWNRTDWVFLTKKEYRYNQQYTFSEIYKPQEWDNMVFNHQLEGRSVFLKTDELTRDTFYYRTGAGSSVFNNLENNTVIVYPNPTSDFFQIKNSNNLQIESINMYDMQGKLVLTKNINFEDAISVSEMSKGVYILEILTDNKIIRNKITVQ